MTTKKRLIDANALTREIEALREEHRGKSTGTIYGGYTSALCAVDGAKTVDAVEVVRCKDCKWRQQDNVNRNFCGLGDFYCGETDFCSRGERKDNEK